MRPLLLLPLVVAIVAIGTQASVASDTFTLANNTGVSFLQNQDTQDGTCWYGGTGAFVIVPGLVNNSSGIGVSGSVTGDMSFSCLGGDDIENWGSLGSYKTPTQGYVCCLSFQADDPAIGSASFDQCGGQGAQFETSQFEYYDTPGTPIEQFMTFEVDGLTCTADWIPGVSASTPPPASTTRSRATRAAVARHTRFVGGLAKVIDGVALVPVQSFGRDAGATVRDRVVLRSKRAVVGTGEATLVVAAKSRRIRVKVAKSVLAKLRVGHELRVSASVSHADGSAGTGDTTARLLLRRLR
jgi:hypothetical protein